MEARESGLNSISNGLEACGLRTAVQQRYTEEEQCRFKILCLADSFRVVETNSVEACFVTMFCNVFSFGRDVQLFCFLRRDTVSYPRKSCAELRILVVGGLHPRSDSYACSLFLTVNSCTHRKTQFVLGIWNHFVDHYGNIERSQSP